jgi:hypothetical protein
MVDIKTDSWMASVVYGRTGAAIWSLIAIIFGMTADEAEVANQAVTGILGGIGVILALVSKIREKIKAKASATTS